MISFVCLFSVSLIFTGDWVPVEPKKSLFEYLQSIDPGKSIKSMQLPKEPTYPPPIWANALDYPDLRDLLDSKSKKMRDQVFRVTYVTGEYVSVVTILYENNNVFLMAEVTSESPGHIESMALWHDDWKTMLQDFKVVRLEKRLTGGQGKRILYLLARMDFFSFPDFDSIPREEQVVHLHPNTCYLEGYKNGHYHRVRFIDDPELEKSYDIQFRELLHYVAKLSKQPWILEGERGSHMKAFEAN